MAMQNDAPGMNYSEQRAAGFTSGVKTGMNARGRKLRRSRLSDVGSSSDMPDWKALSERYWSMPAGYNPYGSYEQFMREALAFPQNSGLRNPYTTDFSKWPLKPLTQET